MATIDLVFEGGGAKGMAFVGALKELLETHGHACGRLLGTSAGAIMATLLAAKYSVPEMEAALAEKEGGRSVFGAFLGAPEPFGREAVQKSAIRQFLKDVNLKFVPDFVENKLDDSIAQGLSEHPRYQNLYSFVERGGWYSADSFVSWLQRKLDEGTVDGKPRRFSQMTLAQFYEETRTDLSVVAADTTAQRMLILNHHTAPACPVVWAVRMSMGIPLMWQEVKWQTTWGPYLGKDITGHIVVDGGMLSNFPLALFLAPDPNVTEMMGPTTGDYVLGLLIDESIPVPVPAERGLIEYEGNLSQLQTFQRLARLVNTMIAAHDNAAIELFHEHVVKLPAGGYGTVEFDMSDERRAALVNAGRQAMQAYLAQNAGRFEATRGIESAHPVPSITDVANRVAQDILKQ